MAEATLSFPQQGEPVPPPSGYVKRLSHKLTGALAGSEPLKGSILAFSSSLWFVLFIVLPSIIVVIFGLTSFNPDLSISYSRLTWAHYVSALDPFGPVTSLTIRTLLVSLATTLGSLIVYYPVAYYMARIAAEKRRGLLISLVVIPFWISFVVYVYAIFPWVQRNGYIGWFLDGLDGLSIFGVRPFHGTGGIADWLFDNWGFGSSNIVIPALIYLWGTYMIFPLFTSLLRIDKELLEAAQNLGAGKWRTFLTVTFPLSFRGVMTGSILVFISAFSAYVEPATLAGQQGHLIGNLIYNLFNTTGNLPYGAAVSVVVIAITVVLLYLYTIFAEELDTQARVLARAMELVSNLWQRLATLRIRERPIRLPDGGPPMRPVRGRLERFYDRLAERRGRQLLAAFFILNAITWYVPLVQVVIFSFNYGFDIVHWDRFSLRWYVPILSRTSEEYPALFGDAGIIGVGWPFGSTWGALWNSFFVGGIATGLSLAIGLPAAMAIARYRFRFKKPLNLMVYTGLVMPSIVMGVSILVFINFLNDLYLWPLLHLKWLSGFESIIVGHITFCIPVVIVVLVATFQEFDRSLEEAAMDLGANEITTFFKVTLPIIAPGIVSAALLAFTFSFGEVVVTSFLKGQGVATLPVIMWSWLSHKIPSPELNAASTLVIGLSLLFVLLANKIQRGGTLFRF